MQLFYLAILLASLYGLMIFVKNGLRLSVSYAQIPFITIIFLMSVLYVAGLFGLLLPVSWLVFLTGLAYLAKHLVRKYSTSRCGNFSSPLNTHPNIELFPLAFFGVLFFLNWFIFRNSMFSQWDEWLSWGLFTKVLVNYDLLHTKLYYNPGHPHYPRITSILQYYFILFLNNGKFHEGTAIFAQTVIFSSAVSAFFMFQKKSYFFLIPSVFAFYCILHLFSTLGTNGAFSIHVYSLYVDSILGLCWGMSVILYLSNRNRMESMIISGLALFSMVQLKETGVFFAFSTILVVTIDKMFFHTSELPIKLKQVGTLIAVVMISWASWSMFKQYNEIGSTRISNVSVSVVNSIEESLLDPQSYKRKVAVNWLRSMTYAGNVNKISANLREAENHFIARFGPTFAFSNFSLSPLYWMIIWGIFVFSLYSIHAGSTGHTYESRNVFLTSMISLAILVLVYSCLILLLYISYFSEHEAVRLASFGRYIGTSFIGIFLVLLYLTLEAQNKIQIVVFITFLCLFTPDTMLDYFSPKDQNNYSHVNGIFKRIDPVINEIKREDPESNILFIDQGGNGYFYTMIKYRAFPLSLKGYASVSTRGRKDWEPWVWVASQEDFRKILQDIDYLIVWNDTEFFEMYGDVVQRSELRAIWKPTTDGRSEKYIFP